MLKLRGFQETAVKAAAGHIVETLALGRKCVIAVSAPTAAGKTVMLASVLRDVTADPAVGKTVWFWFAPYDGLVGQARRTLGSEAPKLRLRDLKTDRHAAGAKNGDLWVATWQSVAARSDVARQARDGDETSPSVFKTTAALKTSNFRIGIVIDEAHLHVGEGTQAMAFLTQIGPDIVLMASATPDTEKQEAVQRALGADFSHISISREDVVAEKLNKPYAIVALVKTDIDAGISATSAREAAIRHGKGRCDQIGVALKKEGKPGIQPLLLVQVENGKEGIQEAERLLLKAGFRQSEIAKHTADEPDDDLLGLAENQAVKALIFKAAIATGFDAPRAWVMVSMRPVKDIGLGLQIIGRLMRVHPDVQEMDEPSEIISTAYLVLADVDSQGGLQAAAAQINKMQTFAHYITVDAGEEDEDGDEGDVEGNATSSEETGAGGGWAGPRNDKAPAGSDGNTHNPPIDVIGTTPLLPFPGKKPKKICNPPEVTRNYPMRSGLDGMPSDRRLLTERADKDISPEAIVAAFKMPDEAILYGWAKGTLKKAAVTTNTLLGDISTGASVWQETSLDDAALENVAWSIMGKVSDPVPFWRALKVRVAESLSSDVSDDEVQRAVRFLLISREQVFRAALAKAKTDSVEIVHADPLPDPIKWPVGLPVSPKNVYGHIPPRLDSSWEFEFIHWMEATPAVIWWHRNVPKKPWAVAVQLDIGGAFYPDFVIRMKGKKPPGLKLADPHGGFASAVDVAKARTTHKEYGRTLLVAKAPDGKFHRVGATPDGTLGLMSALSPDMLTQDD